MPSSLQHDPQINNPVIPKKKKPKQRPPKPNVMKEVEPDPLLKNIMHNDKCLTNLAGGRGPGSGPCFEVSPSFMSTH